MTRELEGSVTGPLEAAGHDVFRRYGHGAS